MVVDSNSEVETGEENESCENDSNEGMDSGAKSSDNEMEVHSIGLYFTL